MTEAAHPLIGAVINNQYRIERKLGEGGMGMVFAARHVRLAHLRFAIKLLVSNYARHEHIRARFFREADAVSRLNHPNIIKVADFGELPDGQLYLVMPLLDGRPLDEYLRVAGKLGAHHALAIAAQVGSALRHLHGHDIVHRDLKPGNIFIERQNGAEIVKLLDFGIAKDARDADKKAATHAGFALGTPFYMASEQYRDASTVTAAADVFALAVVLVEIMTGQLPWGYGEQGVVLLRQLQEPPQFGPEILRAWIPILTQALAPDPRERPQSAREFILALANVLEALPPLWKDGMGIVDDVARDLITNAAPDDATVRSGSGPMASAVPSSAPITVNARPVPAVASASPPTTLAASSGVVAAAQSPAPRRGMLVLLGLGVALVASGLIVAATYLRGGTSTVSAEIDAAAPFATAPSADDAVQAPADATDKTSAVVPDAATLPDAPLTEAARSDTDANENPVTRKIGHHSSTRRVNVPPKAKETNPRSPRSTIDRSKTFDPNAPAGEE